jgi:glycosyltransferase involved in cell wall biosynthesis
MTLAICVPVLGLPSESFVRRHVEGLAPGRTVVIARRRAPDGPGRWDADVPTLWLDDLADSWGGEAEREAVRAFLDEHAVSAVLAEYLDIWLPFLGTLAEHGRTVVAHGLGYDVSARLREPYWREEYGALRGLDAVIVPSTSARDRLAAADVPAEVVPCGVDVPAWTDRGTSGPVRVLAVGRLVAKKHPLATLAAFAAARRDGPPMVLELVGDGPLRPAVEAAAGPGVELPGTLDHTAVLARMRAADVFCQHSVTDPETGDEEGLPVAVLEAMAHGLPVVATRHAGIPEAVIPGRSGLLVDEGDVHGMAAALRLLASDPQLRERMGAEGRRIVTERFSWPQGRRKLRVLLGLTAPHPEGVTC